jgi:hypothetical protein
MARTPETGIPALVRVVPVPGLRFEPVDATPEEAAALVASGSFMYPEAVEADEPKEVSK